MPLSSVVDSVIIVTVDVAVLPSTDILVTGVVVEYVLVTVILLVTVISVNVTWKLTGKLGMVKVQVNPSCAPQFTPFVKW